MDCSPLPSCKEQLLPIHITLCCLTGTAQIFTQVETGTRYEVNWAVFYHLQQVEGRGSGQVVFVWITVAYGCTI